MGAQASSHHRQAPPRCNSELVTSKDLILPADRLQQLTTRLFAADRRDAWRDTRTVATVERRDLDDISTQLHGHLGCLC